MSLHNTHFSFGKMVLYSLGSGVLVLLVSIPIILLIAQWSPVAGLVVALIAVLAMIAAIGTVSRRIIATAEREILAARAATEQQTVRPPQAPPTSSQPRPNPNPGRTEPTDRNSASDG